MVMGKSLPKIGLGVLFAALLAGVAAAQGPKPPAMVTMETTSVAAGMGFSWGDGTLRFNGKDYRFSVNGVTLIDAGISKARAAGEVYNLADLEQFEGTYVAAEASVALGGGVGSLALRNPNGVVMHLRSVSQGARLQLGSSGLKIKFWLPVKN